MESDLPEMYSNDSVNDLTDDELSSRTINNSQAKQEPMVDPLLIQRMQRSMTEMSKRILMLENELRSVKGRMTRNEQGLRETRQDLDTKVSYE